MNAAENTSTVESHQRERIVLEHQLHMHALARQNGFVVSRQTKRETSLDLCIYIYGPKLIARFLASVCAMLLNKYINKCINK